MPTNTYVALDETTVGPAVPSITFTGISGAYTDLVLVVSARSTYAAAEVAGFIRLGNGSIDTGSNYSRTRLLGTGSAASSARGSNLTAISWDAIPGSTSASGNFCTTIISIQNYSNTTTNKTILIRANEPNNYVEAEVGLWRSTSAINQVQIYGDGGGDLAVGSTFSLYGIKAWSDESSPKATGGYVTSDSLYYYHTFPSSSTFTPNQTLSCDILTIAGGGAGARGGGGAGGLVYLSAQSVAASAQTITVGAGGAAPGSDVSGLSNAGNNSQFAALTAAVGGGAGAGSNVNGGTGGSGGGGGTGSGVTRNGGTATSGQGSAGGSAPSTGGFGSGGGGGASAVGGNGTSLLGGSGGAGSNTYSSWATTTSTGVSGYYAGGGGGNSNSSGSSASGGAGGGGIGIKDGNATGPTAGTISTGSGGGGASYYTGGNGGASGGSGIVIVRYLKA